MSGPLPADWIRPDWPVPAGVRAVVTTRRPPRPADLERGFDLGWRDGLLVPEVAASRAALAAALDLPAAPRWLRQVHGAGVHRAAAMAPAAAPRADASVTTGPGVVLAILTADCLPVLLAAADGSCVAAAHAGWRGLAAGVLEAAVRACPRPPAELVAWIGPGIGARSYEVGEEVRAAFLAADPAAEAAFRATRPGHWLCDLAALARRRLQAAGVGRIHGGGFDTFADPRFHSWRRDGARSGRFASLVWLASA